MIQLKRLNKTYVNEGGLRYHAIRDVNLELPGTGMHFITGPSGCGKSTLLNIISGLDVHDEGELLIKGVDTRDFNLAAWDSYRNTYCGFVFQEYNLLDYLTLSENVALGVENTGAKISKEEISKVFAQLGIAGLEDRYPNNCSGGQRQRAAIARVLIKKPRILFADEAAGSVDSASRKVIYDILKELSKELLVIAVTHDPGIVDKYADRVVTMEDGKIVSDKVGLAATKEAAKAVAAAKKPTKKGKEEETVPVATVAKSDADEPLRLVKAKLPTRVVLRLSKTNFTTSKIRTTFTILLTILALTFFAISGIVSNFNGTSANINAFHKQENGFIGLTSTTRTLSEQDIFDFFKGEAGGTIANVPTTLQGQYSEMRLVGNSGDTGATAISSTAGGFTEGVDLSIFASFNGVGVTNHFGQKLVAGKWGTGATEIAISDFVAYQMLQRGIFPAANNITDFVGIVGDGIIPAQKIWLELNSDKTERVELSIVGIYETPWALFFDKAGNVLSEKPELVDVTASQNQIKYYRESVFPVFYGQATVLDTIATGSSINAGASIFLNAGKNTAFGVTVSATAEGSSVKNIFQDSRAIEFRLNTELAGDQIRIGAASSDLIPDAATEIVTTIKRVYETTETTEKTITETITFNTIARRATSLGANDANIIEVSATMLNKLRNLAVTPVTSIGLSQLFSAKQLKAMTKDIEGATLVSAETYNINSVADRLSVVGNAFMVLAIVLALFSVVLLYSFISQSIRTKRRNIGILRAIGTNIKDVFKIFLVEGLILATVIILGTIVTTGIATMISNAVIQNSVAFGLTVFNFNIAMVGIVVGITALVTVLSYVFPLVPLIRKRPIDFIREKSVN